MKVALIQPDNSPNMVGFTSMVRPEPLALGILAAAIPDHDVRILDLRVSPDLRGGLAKFGPDVVGITGYTTDVPRMQELLAEVKALDRDIVTVVGGHHASLVPEDFDRPDVDFIVVGEGEVTFPELLARLEARRPTSDVLGVIYRHGGRQVFTGHRPLSHTMDEYPLPDRHLVDGNRGDYHFLFWNNPYLVETARGCPYRCTFCSVWKFYGGRCRYRSPELVLEDLKQVGSEIVCFVDDNFLQSFRRAERLYQLIKDAGLKLRYWAQVRSDSVVKRPDLVRRWAEIGLHSVLVGFESIVDRELAAINKHNSVATNERAMDILTDAGIDMWGAFLVDPQWTAAEFDGLIDYVRGKHILYPQFTVLTPLPGTDLFQAKLSELITRNYEVFDFLHTVLPTRLPLNEFYTNMARLYASTTMGWGELKRRLREGKIPKEALGRVRDLLRDVTDPTAYMRDFAPVEVGRR